MKKKSNYASPEAQMLSFMETGILCGSPSGFDADLPNISGDDVTDASGSWNL